MSATNRAPGPLERACAADSRWAVDEVHVWPSGLAERLGISERMARRLVSERRIEFAKVGRFVRVTEAAVREYLDANTTKAAR